MPPHRVYSEIRGALSLFPPFASGGEGDLHRVQGYRNLIAKVIRPENRHPHLGFLLETIRSVARDLTCVCPMHESLRSHAGGDVVGYLMDFVSGVPLAKARFRTTLERAVFARDLAWTLSELEQRGAIFSDGHDENVRLTRWRKRPMLIDLDSMSFPDLVLPDGTKTSRHFTKGAPEWVPLEFRNGQPPEHSAFTLAHNTALLVWKALKDEHPAQFVDLDGNRQPLDQFVVNGEFGRFATGMKDLRLVAVDAGIPFDRLPERVKALFASAFALRGLRDPMNRPPASEWAEVLSDWVTRLRVGRLTVAVGGLGAVAAAAALWGPGIGIDWKAVTNPLAVEKKPNDDGRPGLWNTLEKQP